MCRAPHLLCCAACCGLGSLMWSPAPLPAFFQRPTRRPSGTAIVEPPNHPLHPPPLFNAASEAARSHTGAPTQAEVVQDLATAGKAAHPAATVPPLHSNSRRPLPPGRAPKRGAGRHHAKCRRGGARSAPQIAPAPTSSPSCTPSAARPAPQSPPV